jgi:CRISPR-associated protein Cas5d
MLPSYTTYPIPTISAAEGWVKSIGRIMTAQAVIDEVEICSPLRYGRFMFNNRGQGRKAGQVGADQHVVTFLQEVCYKVYGHCLPFNAGEKYSQFRHNASHHYQDLLMRKIKKFHYNSNPYLGWKEFYPSYFGPLREETKRQFGMSFTVKGMLLRTFNNFQCGFFAPKFADVEVQDGVIEYSKFYDQSLQLSSRSTN